MIRENLSTDDVQYVFVTRDAADLRNRLVDDRASPLAYDAEMPAELLEEDAEISGLSLGFDADDVSIVPAEAVFD